MSHALSKSEREAFLAGVHVGVLGLTHNDTPLAVPVWYDYEPGGDISVIMDLDSLKGRALASTRQFSLCAQDEAPPYKYVTVTGEVTAIEACPPDSNRAMAQRYLGEEFGDLYVEASGDISNSRIYRLRPDRWYTVDYAKDFQ